MNNNINLPKMMRGMREFKFRKIGYTLIYGPNKQWLNKICAEDCFEIYVRHIPFGYTPNQIMNLVARFGEIYETHIPVDIYNKNKGAAFVKYIKEADADRAVDVLNHFIIGCGITLEVTFAISKKRLLVYNIPKSIDKCRVERDIKRIMPKLLLIKYNEGITNLSQYDNFNSTNFDAFKNGSYALLFFNSNQEAKAGKICVLQKLKYLWSCDIRVLWYYNELALAKNTLSKTLYLNCINGLLTSSFPMDFFSPFELKRKVKSYTKLTENTALLEFQTRGGADTFKKNLQLKQLHVSTEKRMLVYWARPLNQNSINSAYNFQNKLDLTCMAHGWSVPLIIYGTYFAQLELQYCIVVLRNEVDILCNIFCIVHTDLCEDIQSRICEVALSLLVNNAGIPAYDHIYECKAHSALLLGIVCKNIYHAPSNLPFGAVDTEEIEYLRQMGVVLHSVPNSMLHIKYRSFFSHYKLQTYLSYFFKKLKRMIGIIIPDFCNSASIKYGFRLNNNVYVVYSKDTSTNWQDVYMPTPLSLLSKDNYRMPHVTLDLVAPNLSPNRQSKLMFNCVIYKYIQT